MSGGQSQTSAALQKFGRMLKGKRKEKKENRGHVYEETSTLYVLYVNCF